MLSDDGYGREHDWPLNLTLYNPKQSDEYANHKKKRKKVNRKRAKTDNSQ